jgi:four helix bundle protein
VIKSLDDLRVYRMAMELAIAIKPLTLKFPMFARNELGRQMRLSAESDPANIAEGYGRSRYVADFKRFLINALGSCTELGCQLELAYRHGYIEQSEYDTLNELRDHVGRSLHVTISKWRGSEDIRTADI